jgi:hypothetical protein
MLRRNNFKPMSLVDVDMRAADRPVKPKNMWIAFRNEKNKEMREAGKNTHVPETSKEISRMYHELSAEELARRKRAYGELKLAYMDDLEEWQTATWVKRQIEDERREYQRGRLAKEELEKLTDFYVKEYRRMDPKDKKAIWRSQKRRAKKVDETVKSRVQINRPTKLGKSEQFE